MVREMVTIQVGQCGNQIGRRFWSMLLAEKAASESKSSQGGKFDAAMSAFFRNVDARFEPARDLEIGSDLASLRARAILIDMEEGVLAETLRDPIFGELFDSTQLITDVSGAGNNWAHGHSVYGPQYGTEIEESIRAALEACDSPQSFFLMSSMGGGTGSGLGSFVLEELADNHPKLCRFSLAVYPSSDNDDVITSPYNAVLATQRLTEHSDCVIPLENAALNDLCSSKTRSKKAGGFDDVNDVAAQLLSHLTCGARFGGSLNMDVNELATNLVPFPRMHYLTAGFAPVGTKRPGVLVEDFEASNTQSRHLQRLFAEAVAPNRRLVRASPEAVRQETTLACAFLARGDVVASDVNAAIAKLRPTMKMPKWNPDGFKVGLCDSPPLNGPRAVLCLANRTSVVSTFEALRDKFNLLYSRRAMLHHYTQFVEPAVFDDAIGDLTDLIDSYNTLNTTTDTTERSFRRSLNLEDNNDEELVLEDSAFYSSSAPPRRQRR